MLFFERKADCEMPSSPEDSCPCGEIAREAAELIRNGFYVCNTTVDLSTINSINNLFQELKEHQKGLNVSPGRCRLSFNPAALEC